MNSTRDFEGLKFQMGVSIDEIISGDVIKVSPGNNGRLEKITEIERSSKNWTITTESGRTYDMFQIWEYGKRS